MELAFVGDGDADGEVGGWIGLVFQFSEDLVIGDGCGYLFAKSGIAPREEIFGPERDGAGGELDAGLANWGDPQVKLLGEGQERVVCV